MFDDESARAAAGEIDPMYIVAAIAIVAVLGGIVVIFLR